MSNDPASTISQVLGRMGLDLGVVIMDEDQCRGMDFSLHFPSEASGDASDIPTRVHISAAAIARLDIVDLIHRIRDAATSEYVHRPYVPPFKMGGGAAEFVRLAPMDRKKRGRPRKEAPRLEDELASTDFSSMSPEEVVEWVESHS